MYQPAPETNALFQEALRYDQQGDTYNAVKLYKKVCRLAPSWAPPLQNLGSIYKYRQEWKPALHYVKKAVSADPALRMAWWDLGIAATALKKWRIARSVWRKFGYPPRASWQPTPVSVQLNGEGRFEILWANTLDPVRATLQNIPHPDSGRHFRDIVLIDQQIVGYHVVQNHRYPVYQELGLFKNSGFLTYSCRIDADRPDSIPLLEKLCRDADLGFEIWSRALRQFAPQHHSARPEYYGPGLWEEKPSGGVHVALAARQEKQVLQVLHSWELISLESFYGLECHR